MLSLAGILLGKTLGHIVKGKSNVIGGLVLIGIGLKILIDHLF